MTDLDQTDIDQTEIDRLRSGKVGVLAHVFEQHRGRLERMVMFRMDRRMYGRLDVGDVLQDAYLDAAKRLDQYLDNPCASVFVWLRGIMFNTLSDLHRRHLGAQARDAGKEVSIDSGYRTDETSDRFGEQLISHLTSPSRVALRAEVAVAMRRALTELDDIDREILTLRHFEQLSNSEVSQVLSLSKTAASNRYVRALVKLKEIVESKHSPEVQNP